MSGFDIIFLRADGTKRFFKIVGFYKQANKTNSWVVINPYCIKQINKKINNKVKKVKVLKNYSI